MAIRSKWTDEYRENMPPGVTFTRCMKKNESSAEQMWSTDLSRDMHPVYNPKGAGKTGGKLDKFARQAAAAAKQHQKDAGNKKMLSGKAQPKEQARQVNLSSWARRHLLLTRKLRQQRATAQRISAPSSTRNVVQKDQMDVPSSTNATC